MKYINLVTALLIGVAAALIVFLMVKTPPGIAEVALQQSTLHIETVARQDRTWPTHTIIKVQGDCFLVAQSVNGLAMAPIACQDGP